jgi:hypothetical protein
MLSLNERARLADLEAQLHHRDPRFAARIDATAEMLLSRELGPMPGDDRLHPPRAARAFRCGADRSRQAGTIDRAGARQDRAAGCTNGMSRPVVVRIILTIWAGLWLVLGIESTTRTGMITCLALAGTQLLAVAGSLPVTRAIGRRLARVSRRLPFENDRAAPRHPGRA